MIAPRHLTHAPIKEAIIDIQVTLSDDRNIEELQLCNEYLTKNYPNVKPMHRDVLGLQLDQNKPPKTTFDHTAIGFRYESENKIKIAQFKMNGFTFSHLAPYTTWEDMKSQAQRLWGFYVDAVSPQLITRIATRYINVLEIPLPISNFDDYLTASPKIPDSLPQGIISFLSRLVVPDPTLEAVAIITQALERIEPNHAPIVIDIDTFINKQFDPEANQFWTKLDSLRTFKNKVFFESITEKTAELFI